MYNFVKYMTTKKVYNKKKFFTPLFCCCFWIRDPRSGMGKNQDPGSGINIPDPQHCLLSLKMTPPPLLSHPPPATNGKLYTYLPHKGTKEVAISKFQKFHDFNDSKQSMAFFTCSSAEGSGTDSRQSPKAEVLTAYLSVLWISVNISFGSGSGAANPDNADP